MSTSSTPSLWEAGDHPTFPEPLPATGHVQNLVVGGGLTGLTTALLLARAGAGVAVLEARRLGSGTTGSSTAKVTLLQGTKLSRICAKNPLRVARAYVEANHEGQAWLQEFCEDHDLGIAVRPAGTYAATADQVDAVRTEHDALKAVGLSARWADSLDLPFETHGAVVLENQLQVDPIEVLHGLAEQLRAHGGTLHEGRRVRSVEKGSPMRVHLADGSTVTADTLVIATGAPALTAWIWAAKTSASRSYVLALENAPSVPGMFISAGMPTRSIRTLAPRPGPEGLLVGGSGHGVGRARSEAEHLDDLRDWARQHFPDAVETHAWSAQDYGTPDDLPMYGPLPGHPRVYVASGYDKWGMANAVAAGRAISAEILDQAPSWARNMRDRSWSARSIVSLARLGLESGAVQAKALVGAELRPLPDDVPSGTGTVGRAGLRPASISHLDGGECALSAVCTHMGGILHWNDRELTWDCPLHGSRFDATGEVIEGPATAPLARLEREPARR